MEGFFPSKSNMLLLYLATCIFNAVRCFNYTTYQSPVPIIYFVETKTPFSDFCKKCLSISLGRDFHYLLYLLMNERLDYAEILYSVYSTAAHIAA